MKYRQALHRTKQGNKATARAISRLLKYSPTYGLPPLALALFFRQVSVS